MRKARMTRSEKAFMAWANAIVFATPEIRNGQRYLDRKAWATLSKENQDRYLTLMLTKTR
jgi:hypothetical protein